MLTHTTSTNTREFEQYYDIPTTDINASSSSYLIFTKTPNVSPADSLILNQPLRRSNTAEMRNQSRQNKTFCLPFSRMNKSPYKLLPDRWSFKSNDPQISLAVNGYKAGSNLQETEQTFAINTFGNSFSKPVTLALSSFMPNNPDSVPKKPLKNQTINNNNSQRNKSPLHTKRKQFKDPLSQSSNILKEVENTRYHWLTTKQTHQRSTPILNQERQYGRVNLISAYRGESPPSRVRNDVLSSNSARTEHRGGLFNVHADNRTKAPYYIIHPEWLSETMTIRQLGLSPRPTPLPINNNNYLQGDQVRRRGHFTATCSEQHTTNTDTTCTDSVESSISRSRSLPPKAFNPITWNC